jgi:hypothetical protein
MAYHIIQKFDRNNDDLNETAKLLLISIDQSRIDGEMSMHKKSSEPIR